MQDKDKEKERIKKLRLYKAIAAVITKHRKAQNKSAYTISAEAFIPKSSWLSIEKATSLDPSFTTIWKISEALDIKPEDLIKEVREKLGDDFSLSGLN